MTDHVVPTIHVGELSDPIPADLVILDVREPHEWTAGHIEGATHIPLGELPSRVGELDPEVQTVVICHMGGRSARATEWLHSRGHRVVNLDGGMEAWESAQRPVER